MKLQNLVMPQSDLKDQEKMYFRLNRRARLANCHQEVLFEKGGVASLDTYFNSLSIEKWRKYTNIGKISISLLLHGSFQIQLLRKEKIHNSVAEKELLITRFRSDAPEWITLPFSSYEEKGMYAVKLKCASEKGHLLDGYYSGEVEPDQCNPVRLAIDICTFRREAFVERNFIFSVKISIPLENTGVSSVFATSVWPFSLIFSLARRNEGNFFQAVPTTLSSSLAEVRLASLVAWA